MLVPAGLIFLPFFVIHRNYLGKRRLGSQKGAGCPVDIRLARIGLERRVPEMNGNDKRELPWWQKYTLTLNEAQEYFGIGYKKLKLFVQEHSDADFVLWNGNRALIKREQFEKYMDSQMNVIQFIKIFLISCGKRALSVVDYQYIVGYILCAM